MAVPIWVWLAGGYLLLEHGMGGASVPKSPATGATNHGLFPPGSGGSSSPAAPVPLTTSQGINLMHMVTGGGLATIGPPPDWCAQNPGMC